ncbi:MAG: hypothetical protein JO006_18410 [Paucibacter sp.]|nr:hypothetical protein [Roseateles sp.]
MRANVLSVGARRWRLVVWCAALALLLMPGLAMKLTYMVQWNKYDFAVFASMLAGACVAYELLARGRPSHFYRAGFGLGLLGAFLLVWLNLEVGLIGSESDPANLMFGGVLLIGAAGAAVARLQPRGMSWTLAAMAGAQAMAAGIGVVMGWHQPLVLQALFVMLWGACALLFRRGDGQLGRLQAQAT